MTASAPTVVSPSLAAGVVAALRRAGEQRPVRAVETVPFALASSWPAVVFRIHLRDGPPVELFGKDLSRRRHDGDIEARRAREAAVHATLLPRLDLGTPRWYGTVTDPETTYQWLLLELVDGTPVRWEPLPVWLRAAAWLARLHARVAADPTLTARCPQVRPVTAEAVLATAAAATDAAGSTAPDLGRRVVTALVDHAEVADALAAAPRTLVHGGYRPQNILWCPATPPRVCPVDWEEAALGPDALDLAFLTDGFDPPRRAQFVDAYRHAAADHGLLLEERGSFEARLEACGLHKTLGTLAKATDRGFPPAAVARLVAMVEAAAARARPRPVRHLTVTPSPYAGRARADIVSFDRDDGSTTAVHVKHTAPFDGDPDKRRRDREAWVYEHLLDRPDLPVADHLGTIHLDGGTAIVLAHVDGGDLRYHDLDVWRVAAAALGTLQAHFVDDARLAAPGALLRLDADWLSARADRAVAQVAARSHDLGEVLRSALADRRALAAPLDACAPTLVHNDLAPKNVMADPATTPPTIRIVDWELAGVGCGMLDLVHLCHGLTDAQARPLHAAHEAAVAGTGVLPGDPDARARVVAACRIHRTLYRLAHLPTLDATPATVVGWVDDVVRWRAAL